MGSSSDLADPFLRAARWWLAERAEGRGPDLEQTVRVGAGASVSKRTALLPMLGALLRIAGSLGITEAMVRFDAVAGSGYLDAELADGDFVLLRVAREPTVDLSAAWEAARSYGGGLHIWSFELRGRVRRTFLPRSPSQAVPGEYKPGRPLPVTTIPDAGGAERPSSRRRPARRGRRSRA